MIRPGDIHFNEHDSSENVLDFVVFNPIILGDIYSSHIELIPYVGAEQAEKFSFAVDGTTLFDTLHRELRSKERYYDAAVKSRLRSFWVDYLRHFATGEQGGALVSPNRLSRIRVLLDYIRPALRPGHPRCPRPQSCLAMILFTALKPLRRLPGSIM